MTTDAYVQVFPDSTGKKIDTSEVVRSDGTTTVERERFSISDPTERDEHAEVSGGELSVNPGTRELLIAILETLQRIELRLT